MVITQRWRTAEANLFSHREPNCPWKSCWQKYASATHWFVWFVSSWVAEENVPNSSLQYHTILKFHTTFLILLALAGLAWAYYCLTLSVQFYLNVKDLKPVFYGVEDRDWNLNCLSCKKGSKLSKTKQKPCALTICPTFYSKELYFTHLH